MRKAIPFLALLTLTGLILVQVGCSKDEDPVTPPPACSIVVDEFNSWDFFYTGDDINIRWTKTTGDNVQIELFKGAAPAGVITASTPNTGFFPWLNSTTFGRDSGEDFSIKVTHLQDAACGDQTNEFEMIDVSNCFIKFPWTVRDSIEAQNAGNEFIITWESDHTSGFVDLELWRHPYLDLPVKVEDLALNLPDNGTFTWTVDSYHQGTNPNFSFRIRDVNAHRCTDTSVNFIIIDNEICTIDVLGISEGQTYAQGTVIPISFAFENSSGVVDLKLYSGNAEPPVGSITDGFDTQNGTINFNWTVTDFGHPGPSYSAFNVKAWDSDDDNCIGESGHFTIAQ